ncbi:MAG: hypothetical protein ACT4OJ_04870 [Bacteroidota bacterium]
MIAIKDNQLCICIPCSDAQQIKDSLLKALAAAFRWRASYPEDYNGDDHNLTVLSQLQEQLTDGKIMVE